MFDDTHAVRQHLQNKTYVLLNLTDPFNTTTANKKKLDSLLSGITLHSLFSENILQTEIEIITNISLQRRIIRNRNIQRD